MSIKYEQPEEIEEEQGGEGPQGEPEAVDTPFYTYALAASIVIVYIVQFLTDLGYHMSGRSVLLTGFLKDLFREGEYWRMLTGATVHGSPIHIFFNAMALVSFGRLVEMLSNKAHLAILVVLSAIGGGILSVIFDPAGRSVGASGGIIGLLGYLIVYSMRRKQFLNPEFRRSLLFNAGFIVIYGLVLYQLIDNFAHLGGFLTGAVYGFLQIPSDPHIDPREVGKFTELAGLGALGIFIATCGFSILLLTGIV